MSDNRRTIKAVFAAEGFSKWIAADFEGLVSSRSIFKILDMCDQMNEETENRGGPRYLPQKLKSLSNCQMNKDAISDIRKVVMKLLFCC
jgi:hypothetical protein